MFRMRLALWRNRASATWVLAAALLVVLSACTTTPAAQEEETPTPVLFTATTMTADTVTAVLPADWKNIQFPPSLPPFVHYAVSLNGIEDTSVPSFRLVRYGPEMLPHAYKEVAPDTYDIDSIVRGQLIDISTSEYYSEITDLGTRTIGGATARGYSFTEIFDGISHRTEKWHVGRHDGLWTIQLSSADNDTTLPPEIYDILNTITWATPTPLTFTTTTGTADTVTATLPADWKEIPRRTYDPASYVASPNGIGNASVPSIRLLRTHPGDLSSTYGQITLDTYDLGYIVNRTINDIQNDSMYSNIADLGTRTINDTTARGYTFIKTVDGISHRYEIWELGRHDGLWTIQLRSALNDTTLPPEIYDILNTITWTTPTR